MTIILTVYRYFEPHRFECQSIAEAVGMAIDQLDADASFPYCIEVDDQKIWEQDDDPHSVRESLERLLEKTEW